jgi:GNAT superfamily N-acetyltransferase
MALTDLFDADDDTIQAEMERAINGTYAGLTATVDRGHSIDDSSFEVGGRIFAPDGTSIGRFLRGFVRRPDGKLVAHHDSMKIDPEYQGTGFASDFNANLIAWYRRSGFDQVDTEANEDVGGYAWPSQGFDFANEDSFEMWAASAAARLKALTEPPGSELLSPTQRQFYFDSLAADFPGISPEQLQAQIETFKAMLEEARNGHRPVSAYELSQVGRTPGQGKGDMWIGKYLMLGSSFEATLPLKEASS